MDSSDDMAEGTHQPPLFGKSRIKLGWVERVVEIFPQPTAFLGGGRAHGLWTRRPTVADLPDLQDRLHQPSRTLCGAEYTIVWWCANGTSCARFLGRSIFPAGATRTMRRARARSGREAGSSFLGNARATGRSQRRVSRDSQVVPQREKKKRDNPYQTPRSFTESKRVGDMRNL